MNRQECQHLIEEYVEWLRKGLSAEMVGTACELTTPFIDRHNDQLQIYAVRKNGKIILSDDGYILSDLRTSGVEFRGERRKQLLTTILNGFGVKLDRDELQIEAGRGNLGQRVHSLIQAMLAVNDMFVVAQAHVASLFLEDVQRFLDANNVRYSAQVKIAGKSGYDHGVDFLIPRSSQRPERFIKAINAPNKNTVRNFLFLVTDTRDVRPSAPEAYAFLNDQNREIGGDVFEALESYDVVAVPWSQRKEHADALAA
jgi:hypothetical protein